MQNNNDHLQSSDVSEPSKLNGLDTQWDDFYLQLRIYLEVKGLLVTFEHPHGHGSPGFDNEMNKKIYNKLLTLCRKGTAATYITKAALSNGWEAARYLLDRYEGFSKQREKSLRNLVDNLHHVNGTNISRHVDRFEKICGLMAHNNPSKSPTEEEKIDWFLASVTERTYESVHTSCTDKRLEGTLAFAKVIKLYTHRCFQRYPHFQQEDLDATDSTKPLSNNANSTFIRSPKGKGKGQDRGRTTPHRPDLSRDRSRPRHSSSRPSRPSTPKECGKVKPSGHRGSPAPNDNRKPKEVAFAKTPTGDPCSYCGRTNHNARNCYKRQEDEKTKLTSSHKQAHQSILVDETAFQFSQSVLSVYHSDFPNNPHHHGNDWGEQTQYQEDQQKHDVPEEEQQRANKDLYHDTKTDETPLASPSASDPGSLLEESDQECQQIKEAHNKNLSEPEITSTITSAPVSCPYPFTARTETDTMQSSSSEPNWGKYRQRTQQELEHDWQE